MGIAVCLPPLEPKYGARAVARLVRRLMAVPMSGRSPADHGPIGHVTGTAPPVRYSRVLLGSWTLTPDG